MTRTQAMKRIRFVPLLEYKNGICNGFRFCIFVLRKARGICYNGNIHGGHMEFRVLKYFLTVAREENMTKAAEILYITQPTLSRQIAELEDELGTPLFVRSNRNVTLTDAGVLLRRRAEEMLALEDKIKDELSAKENLGGNVSIGMAEAASANTVADMIGIFREKYPSVKFDLYTAMADQVLERIDKGIIDVGFLLEPVNVDKYDFIRLPDTERMGILMRSDSVLAQKEALVPEDLLDLPLIVPMRRELQQNSRNIIGSIYDRFNIIATFNVVNNALLLAERGIGYVLLVEGAAQYHRNPNICFRPLKTASAMHCVAVWKKYQPSGHAVSRFLEGLAMLIEHKSF